MTDTETKTSIRTIVHKDLPETIEFSIPKHGVEVSIEPTTTTQFRGVLTLNGQKLETKSILKFGTAVKGVLEFILDHQEETWINWAHRAAERVTVPVVVNGVYYDKVADGTNHHVVFSGTQTPVPLMLKEFGVVPAKLRGLFPDTARFVDPEGY